MIVGKRWKVLAMAAFGCMGLAPVASAATIEGLIQSAAGEMAGLYGGYPQHVILEDDHFELVIYNSGTANPLTDDFEGDGINDAGRIDWVGDRLEGILSITSVVGGLPPSGPVQSVTVAGSAVSLSSQSIELSAHFDLAALSYDAVAGKISFGGGALTNGSMIDVFVDTTPDFFGGPGPSFATRVASVTNGTLWAQLGMTGVGTEFYTVSVKDYPVPGVQLLPTWPFNPVGPIPASGDGNSEFSLNFIGGAPMATIKKNTLGTDAYGDFQIRPSFDTQGNPNWQTTGDGDITLLVAPLPQAAMAGLGLLTVLAGGSVVRRYRQS